MMETIVVTGGSGFLGSHIVKELQESNLKIKEIRIVDIVPYENNLGHAERKPLRQFLANLTNIDMCRSAFKGATSVIHSAARVAYNQHWVPDDDVLVTQNVISLCIEANVSRLVFTSTAEVCFKSYLKSSLALIINQTESRASPPENSQDLLIPGYASSKLDSERLILNQNGTQLSGGEYLQTVALRPTLLYGDGDSKGILTSILINSTKYFGGLIPRLAGIGGRMQMTYVGNAAYAHILAIQALQKENSNSNPALKISGYPVFITDDTPCNDFLKFAERISDGFCQMSKWYLPGLIAISMAFFIQIFISLFRIRVFCSPQYLISLLQSVVIFNRLRSELYLDYKPKYDYKKACQISRSYYKNIVINTIEELYQKNDNGNFIFNKLLFFKSIF